MTIRSHRVIITTTASTLLIREAEVLYNKSVILNRYNDLILQTQPDA